MPGALDLPPLELGPVVVEVGAALGAQGLPFVGDAADPVRYDPVATETVRVVPATVHADAALTVAGPVAATGALRVEEGQVHAGGLEAAEARVGLRVAGEALGGEAWVGRGDLPVLRDRARELEALALSTRPLLSRTELPLHATGAGVELGWDDRVGLEAGIAYPSLTADAPWTWARLDLTPLGPLSEWQGAPRGPGAPVVGVGGGVARLGSESLGTAWLVTADLAAEWRGVDVEAGWTRTGEGREGVLVGAGARLVAWRQGADDVHLAARGERVTGMEEGEDARWLGAVRLSTRLAHGAAAAYVEALLSREQGSGLAPGEDVVDLDASAERANDVLAVGLLLRL